MLSISGVEQRGLSYTCLVLFPIAVPFRLVQSVVLSSLCCTVWPCWLLKYSSVYMSIPLSVRPPQAFLLCGSAS